MTTKEDKDLLERVHSSEGENPPGAKDYMEMMERSEDLSKRVEQYTAQSDQPAASVTFSSQSE